ncbi:MAG TPA: hypothetical protein VHL56_01000, partial [Candidatus Limnocylindrales bacterium]|nr:hypothetical protein [Candidatus Limnocylindrales bacterium]
MTHPGQPVRVTLALELPDGPPALVVDASSAGVDGSPASAGDVRHALVLRMEPAVGQARGVERREVIVDGWRIEVLVEPEARAALRERARRGN